MKHAMWVSLTAYGAYRPNCTCTWRGLEARTYHMAIRSWKTHMRHLIDSLAGT